MRCVTRNCVTAKAMVASAEPITFLFTDIEGSTRLWEAEPARMSDALARHDALCRTAVDAHRGRLVKMVGDGLHAVFDDPADAVASTLDLQRGMARIAADCGIALRMRCGVHAGISDLRDGDYFGIAVNRAARIAAAAHGGQILLSQAAVDLCRRRLPAGVDVIHLGRVRLRDLSAPEDIWQVAGADLPTTFPALRSLDSTPNNLPQQLTTFIGREQEIAQIKKLIRTARIITLTGAGGCGKTRLALHVAADVLEDYPDGVWLVELAALADPLRVPQSVASLLGLKEEPGKPLLETLTDHLATRHLMLLIDNAEHLLAACAEFADAVLRRCPRLSLVVTSREALGFAGELTYRVPSLSMPDPRRDGSREDVARFESARLFIERARSQQPGFALTEQNAPALASICYRLDGIPLAIELAAARVRSLSLEEVNARLNERFRLLIGGSRTALPRQQTLRSLIDWSYDLLAGQEQAMLRRLAVFAGGFTLDAAERVCAVDSTQAPAILDLLASLVDKSLVIAEERGETMRYRMLETIRQYARERLLEHGDGSRWRDRHLAYFRAVGAEAEPRLTGPDQRAWLERLENELDNVRAALAWAADAGGDTCSGSYLAASLWRFWQVRAYFSEGRTWLSALLAADDGTDPHARANALNAAGALAMLQGDHAAARQDLEECVALSRRIGNRHAEARSFNNLGNIAYAKSDYAGARELFQQSLAIRRAIDDCQGVADGLNNLGGIAYQTGDYPAALAYYHECLALRRRQGDRWATALLLTNLGAVADAQSDFATSRSLYEEALAIQRDLGDRWAVPTTLKNLGDLAYAQRDYAQARALYEEGIAICREVGDRRGVAMQLSDLGKVAVAVGDYPAARVLSQECLPLMRELGDLRGMTEVLEGLAIVALARKDADRAVRIMSAAERLRDEIGFPLRPKERSDFERQMASLRAASPDAKAFDQAWQAGRAMTVDEAVDYALQS
jgi:predicted ATPase/class 3 adenylate cyclase/Tfp pilus assembly protein PilF